ncbi:MAG: putative MFS-type transporter YhjX [Phycisphaerae bacterium]|nr:putative MFS-type transporter YhjX [Phycisphaerae bacterium]
MSMAAHPMTQVSTTPAVVNRWRVVVGAILIQFALGAIYAWAVFTKKLELKDGLYGFSAQQTLAIFSTGLATFSLVLLFAGKLQARIGPRKTAQIGGVVLGLGYILGGLLGSSFGMQWLFIGLIGGAGIGLGYVVPIACCVKWFPDKKGLITGLAVAGFGFGATIWVKLAGGWKETFGGFKGGLFDRLHEQIFGLPDVQAVFLVYGVAFLLMVLLGSLTMVNPPVGWSPAGWNPQGRGGTGSSLGQVDFSVSQMVATPQYWVMMVMYIGTAMAGLMVIGCIKLFGIDNLLANQAAVDKDAAGIMADTALVFLAIFNGLGRIIWGLISDKTGRKAALLLMSMLQGAMLLALFKVAGSEKGLILAASVVGFNFGGTLALFPSATADYFGNKRVGVNYPFVFLAYGIAGIVGNLLSAYFKDLKTTTAGGVELWSKPFMAAGIACLVAGLLALALKPPQAPTPAPT